MQPEARGAGLRDDYNYNDDANQSAQMRSFLKQLEREMEEDRGRTGLWAEMGGGQLGAYGKSEHDQIRQFMMQLRHEEELEGVSDGSEEDDEVARSRQRMLH